MVLIVPPTIAVARNPMAITTQTETKTLTAQAVSMGVIVQPASVADPPRTPWTNSGMNVSRPNRSTPIAKLPTPELMKVLAATLSGMSVDDFEEQVKPHLDGTTIRFLGPADVAKLRGRVGLRAPVFHLALVVLGVEQDEAMRIPPVEFGDGAR